MNHSTTSKLRHYRRLRWVVLIAVVLGIAASVAMNVLHAQPNLIARAIAGAPPVALFLSVELISRIPSTMSGTAVKR